MRWKTGLLFATLILSNSALASNISEAEIERVKRSASDNEKIITVNQSNGSTEAIVVTDGDQYRYSSDGRKFSDNLSVKPRIKLSNAGSFDPLKEKPQANSLKLNRAESANETGVKTYIVQFITQPLPEMQSAIKALGGEIYSAIPDQALLIRMDTTSKYDIADLPFVRWVGHYHPSYKLEPSLQAVATGQESGLRGSQNRVVVLLLDDKDSAAVSETIKNLGGEVFNKAGSRLLEANLPSGAIVDLAQDAAIEYIETWTPNESDMATVREYGGANFLEDVANYRGQGVRGEVMDDGLRTGHIEFQANTPMIHGGNSDDNGHGTPVYGIVFASGDSDSSARGMLPDAEQPIFSSNNRSYNRDSHTGELVDPNGRYRAVFQTNSWGSARTRDYTSRSAQMDDIIFKHDILITQSQSNAGNRDSRPQAWAKNIVSVGGFRHRNTLTKSDDEWDGSASIGPAADGRLKPDLSHFYDSTYTTSNSGNTSYRNFGGTSGATPITAGHFGLLFQMWADGVFDGGPGKNRDVFDSRPHAATAKALMINSAYQYSFSGRNADMTRVHQGWGAADVKSLYESAQSGNWRLPILVDESEVLRPLQSHSYTVDLNGGEPFKVTMVYMDPSASPSASIHRVNDLTLKVTSPSGTVYWGNNGLRDGNWSTAGGNPNRIDTVENVFIQNPASGTWTVTVSGDEIIRDAHVETSAIDADYALVATGGGWASSANAVVIQENETGFCGLGGDVDSHHAGFTGAGFANTTNTAGTGVDWKIRVPSAGEYVFEWRYSNGADDRPGRLLVDGSSVVNSISFPNTGGWANWSTVRQTVSLTGGTHSIRLEGTAAASLGHIDNLRVSGDNPRAADCTVGDDVLVLQENETGFCGVDGEINSRHAGHTAAGYANTDNQLNTGVNWQFSVPQAGNYVLEWRYSNGSDNRPGDVIVDGGTVVNSLDFPSTGGWAAWELQETTVSLSAGSHSLRLDGAGNDSLGHINRLGIKDTNSRSEAYDQ